MVAMERYVHIIQASQEKDIIVMYRMVLYLLIILVEVNHFDSLLLSSDSIPIEEHISTASSSNSLYLSPIL